MRKVVTETRTVRAAGGGVTEVQVVVGGSGPQFEYTLPSGEVISLDYELRPDERREGYGYG